MIKNREKSMNLSRSKRNSRNILFLIFLNRIKFRMINKKLKQFNSQSFKQKFNNRYCQKKKVQLLLYPHQELQKLLQLSKLLLNHRIIKLKFMLSNKNWRQKNNKVIKLIPYLHQPNKRFK